MAFGVLILVGLAIMAIALRPFATPIAGTPIAPTFVEPAMPPLPAIEASELLPETPRSARTINAGRPFATTPNPAAAPYFAAQTGADFTRALDCLAHAVLYEAGDDREGQRAVAQVVLNRVRHPAFPATICGVVSQGSERATGCQFTFTCDGALRRRWSDAAWLRARAVAGASLAGAVYAPVGWATHYHTDWVVPVWSARLDKVAAVGTHLFFRWPGRWGMAGAFRRTGVASEPLIAAIAKVPEAPRVAPATLVVPIAPVTASDAPIASEPVIDLAPPPPPVAMPVIAPQITAPRRKPRDPCAAMRMVAAADRVGPCATRW